MRLGAKMGNRSKRYFEQVKALMEGKPLDEKQAIILAEIAYWRRCADIDRADKEQFAFELSLLLLGEAA